MVQYLHFGILKFPLTKPWFLGVSTEGINGGWDPLKEILNLRAMELKHGRVAMLAVLGWFHVAAGCLGRWG